MLTYNLKGNILEVTEVIHGWRSTKITYWYYDIKNWRVSKLGVKDEIPTSPMTQEAIDWVKKNYLPKVQLTPENNSGDSIRPQP